MPPVLFSITGQCNTKKRFFEDYCPKTGCGKPKYFTRLKGIFLLRPEDAFAYVLRKLRKAKGFSQEELAYQSGLDRTYISLLERGLRQPSLSSILQLADPLGVSSSEMIAQVEEKLNEDTSN
jgi:predicted transcriptional regulator